VYFTPEDTLYGIEVGCATTPVYGGGRMGSSGHLGYEYFNDPRILVLRSDKTWTIYQNSGRPPLSYFNSGTWYFGPPVLLEQDSDLPSADD